MSNRLGAKRFPLSTAEATPVVGHVALYDEDVFPTFQSLEMLLRAIEPLAQVLDAAGAVILEQMGRRLMVQ